MNLSLRPSTWALSAVFVLPQISSAAVLAGSNGGNPLLQAIAWQTFENAGTNNNSGINDATPDSNSTFDTTPNGANSNGFYLVGGLGASSGSALGRQGFGRATANNFLQGPTVGANLAIVDIPDANVDGLSGTPGTQQNTQGVNGSAWKFRTNGNQEFGDFSITNVSAFTFRLEHVHFDARAGAANSPNDLDFIYLRGGSNLTRVDNGNEIADLAVIDSYTFANVPSVINESLSLATRFGTAVRLAPGDSAIFRFRWTSSNTDSAQSQIDNLGFSGTFQDQNNSFASIDPAAVVPEPSGIILLSLASVFGLVRRKR